jgi:hypothetical protein
MNENGLEFFPTLVAGAGGARATGKGWGGHAFGGGGVCFDVEGGIDGEGDFACATPPFTGGASLICDVEGDLCHCVFPFCFGELALGVEGVNPRYKKSVFPTVTVLFGGRPKPCRKQVARKHAKEIP